LSISAFVLICLCGSVSPPNPTVGPPLHATRIFPFFCELERISRFFPFLPSTLSFFSPQPRFLSLSPSAPFFDLPISPGEFVAPSPARRSAFGFDPPREAFFAQFFLLAVVFFLWQVPFAPLRPRGSLESPVFFFVRTLREFFPFLGFLSVPLVVFSFLVPGSPHLPVQFRVYVAEEV